MINYNSDIGILIIIFGFTFVGFSLGLFWSSKK
jgi:hypothetical protein